jgi:hypothetical protein
MFRTDAGWLVADSRRLWDVATELGIVERERGQKSEHPFATPLGTRRIIERIGLDRADQFGILTGAEPGEALLEGLNRLWELRSHDAQDLAGALAEGGRFAHLLRFSHTGPEAEDTGGYSITVIG